MATAEFELMPNGSPPAPVHSEGAGASLSMGDVNFDGVRHHDINKVDPQNRMITFAIAGAASLAVLVGLLAMWVEMSMITYIAFAVPLLTAPAVVIQRTKIQWLPTFREEHNKLRLLVGDFAMANNRLSAENGRLERQLARLDDVESRFEKVVKRDRKDVDRTMDLVRVNGRIQREMKKLQAAKDLQLLFELILKSDKNEDERIGPEELDRFIIRVRAIYGKNHRVFNEDNIRDAFKHSMGRHTISLLHITESLHEDEAALAQAEEENEQYPGEVVESLQKVPSRAMEETTLQKVPRSQQQPATIRQTPSKDPPASTGRTDIEGGQNVPIDLTGVPEVRSTGLVLPNNSEGMMSEGILPKAIYGSPADDEKDLAIKNTTSDILLEQLLSNDTQEFDAASAATDDALHKVVV